MVIGTCSIQLYFSESGSLKRKRQFIKRIKDRVRNKFNVSIAEIKDNELWQRATLGVSTIANDKRFINEILSKVVQLIQGENGVEVLDYQIEIF
jgi:uncharacterized protein YlxP (DUF503 family)